MGRPLILRRTMANKVSKIGKPNTIAGTTNAMVAAVLTAPITEIAANV